MNPFIRDILGSMVRTVLAGVAGRGLIAGGDVEQYASAITLLLVACWSCWQKFVARQKLVAAIASPAPTTEKQIEAVVAVGLAPSVKTPKDLVPVVVAK